MQILIGTMFLLAFLGASVVMLHTLKTCGGQMLAALAGPSKIQHYRYIRVQIITGPRQQRFTQSAQIVPIHARKIDRPSTIYRPHLTALPLAA
jgi:hypothetical protein